MWILSIFLCLQKTSSWDRSPPPFRSPHAKWPFKSFHRYSVFAASRPDLAASAPPPRPHVRRQCEHKSRSCQKKKRPNISEKPLKIGDGNLIGSLFFFPICNCIIRQMLAQVDILLMVEEISADSPVEVGSFIPWFCCVSKKLGNHLRHVKKPCKLEGCLPFLCQGLFPPNSWGWSSHPGNRKLL